MTTLATMATERCTVYEINDGSWVRTTIYTEIAVPSKRIIINLHDFNFNGYRIDNKVWVRDVEASDPTPRRLRYNEGEIFGVRDVEIPVEFIDKCIRHRQLEDELSELRKDIKSFTHPDKDREETLFGRLPRTSTNSVLREPVKILVDY